VRQPNEAHVSLYGLSLASSIECHLACDCVLVLFLLQDHRASPRRLSEHKASRGWQHQKFNAPKRAARGKMIMRHGGELRGNSYDRRRRKLWLLNTFGTGRICKCHWCGKRLTFKTLTQDRLLPGDAGGRYIKSNLVPACLKCNQTRHSHAVTPSARCTLSVTACDNPKPRRVVRFWRRDYTVKEFLAITR
jgi:hypothetical protein